jgi:hypothetical protein
MCVSSVRPYPAPTYVSQCACVIFASYHDCSASPHADVESEGSPSPSRNPRRVLSPVSKVDWLSLADACTASDDDIGREGLHSEDELRWGGARRRGGVRACGIDEVR